MPEVHFQLCDGKTASVTCAEGDTLMQVASLNAIPGIEAVCGGFCNCATCHVYVSPRWIDKLQPPSDEENEMLDGTAADRLPGSRLACQIKVTQALDGLEVRMPDRQA